MIDPALDKKLNKILEPVILEMKIALLNVQRQTLKELQDERK